MVMKMMVQKIKKMAIKRRNVQKMRYRRDSSETSKKKKIKRAFESKEDENDKKKMMKDEMR